MTHGMHHGMMHPGMMMNPGMMHNGMHGGHLIGPPVYAYPAYGYGYWPWIPYWYNAPTRTYMGMGYGAGNYRVNRTPPPDIPDYSKIFNPGGASSTGVMERVGGWFKNTSWSSIIGGLGGMWLANKLLGSWGVGMWDSLMSIATVAVTAIAGAIVLSKGVEILNRHGERNRYAATAPEAAPYVQNERALKPSVAPEAGNMDRAVAQFKSATPTAVASAEVPGMPTNAPITPTIVKNNLKKHSKPTLNA